MKPVLMYGISDAVLNRYTLSTDVRITERVDHIAVRWIRSSKAQTRFECDIESVSTSSVSAEARSVMKVPPSIAHRKL